jgi:hypothetical protein
MLPLEIRSNMTNEMQSNHMIDTDNAKSMHNSKTPMGLMQHHPPSQQQRNGPSLIFDPNKIMQNDESTFNTLMANKNILKPAQSMDHQTPSYNDSYNTHTIAYPKINKIKQSSKKQTDHGANSNPNTNLYSPLHKQPSNHALNEYLSSNVNEILLNPKYHNHHEYTASAPTSTSSNLTHSILTGTPILINTLTNNIPKLVDSTKTPSNSSNTNNTNSASSSNNGNNSSSTSASSHNAAASATQQPRPTSGSATQHPTPASTQNTEIRKFEKINQLLSLQTSNSQSLQSSEYSTQKPSAYVTPVMIKQNQNPNSLASSIQLSLSQQQQHQNQNMLYNNSKNFYQQQQQAQESTSMFNTQPITPPLQAPVHSSTTSTLTTTTTSSTTNTSSISNTITSSSTMSSNTTTNCTSNEMYYPSQNILLTPSLTLNYGWQNLLQHVDPASTNSLLSLVPHFSNIDLLSLQHHHQKQQQQQQQMSEHANNSIATALAQGGNKTSSS